MVVVVVVIVAAVVLMVIVRGLVIAVRTLLAVAVASGGIGVGIERFIITSSSRTKN